MISAPDWKMVQEQWQVQMWCKVLDVIGEENHLLYCCLDIPRSDYVILPGLSGLDLIQDLQDESLTKVQKMSTMVERALAWAIRQTGKPDPSIVLLKDGPYGIPELSQR